MGLNSHGGSTAPLAPGVGLPMLKASADVAQPSNLATNGWENSLGGRRTSWRLCWRPLPHSSKAALMLRHTALALA